jgi:hypothetical protein
MRIAIVFAAIATLATLAAAPAYAQSWLDCYHIPGGITDSCGDTREMQLQNQIDEQNRQEEKRQMDLLLAREEGDTR